MHRSIFLDRDGVLIEEHGLLVDPARIRLFPWSAEAVRAFKECGFKVIVVSNQPVVARGLAGEDDVEAVNRSIQRLLERSGGPGVDAWYFCPHHPSATLPQYRIDCDCRKPRPGLLLRAAGEQAIDLRQSCMIGDRITDVIAGKSAGCRTILIESGAHRQPPIETADPIDPCARPDHVFRHLGQAAEFITGRLP